MSFAERGAGYRTN